MTTTHYDTLEISPKATAAVISAAYRTLSQKYHPDKNNGDKHCEEMMAKINVAFGVLSDALKRKIYDEEIGLNQSTSNNTNVGVAPTQQQPKQEESQQSQPKVEQSKSNNGYIFAAVIVVIFGFLIYSANEDADRRTEEQQRKYQAEQDSKVYQWENADALLTGKGNVQNFQKALEEYKKIVDKNYYIDKRAEQRIAEINFFGLGQDRNYTNAIEWYKKCYEPECYFMLGWIYLEGLGVQKNWIVAYHYFNNAQGVMSLRINYKSNPLVQDEQNKFMFSSKQESEKAFLQALGENKTMFAISARAKKEFLSKQLTTDEINKAQNLDIK